VGHGSLHNNTTGEDNTAVGNNAMRNITTGRGNTAVGKNAMADNTVGNYNIAFGTSALQNNRQGQNNTAIGMFSLQNNLDTGDNAALGWGALMNTTSSYGNTALGAHAGQYLATSSNNNTFIGNYSGVTEVLSNTIISNSIAIGANALVTASNTMVFGNDDVNYWSFGRSSNEAGKVLQVGNDSTNGNGAYLTSGGVWTNASSIDFKTDIKRLSSSDLLSSINQLLVAKWRYKDTNEYHIGPFAEQFKKIFSVGVDRDDKHISTMDVAGVSIIGIQELSGLVSKLQTEKAELTEEIDELKDRLTLMEQKLNMLINQNP
jgi:hypothetical protein